MMVNMGVLFMATLLVQFCVNGILEGVVRHIKHLSGWTAIAKQVDQLTYFAQTWETFAIAEGERTSASVRHVTVSCAIGIPKKHWSQSIIHHPSHSFETGSDE